MVDLEKTLITDDEEQFSIDLGSLLGVDYEVITAGGSRKGLESINATGPDPVILDLVMPAYSAQKEEDEGTKFLRLLKKGKLSKIPVIILTKQDIEEVRKKSLFLGAEGYFQKPPAIVELKQKIGELIGKDSSTWIFGKEVVA